jgi:hypothetical protein
METWPKLASIRLMCKAKWHKTLPQLNGIISKSKGQKGV